MNTTEMLTKPLDFVRPEKLILRGKKNALLAKILQTIDAIHSVIKTYLQTRNHYIYHFAQTFCCILSIVCYVRKQ